jgi:hypothetical protein
MTKRGLCLGSLPIHLPRARDRSSFTLRRLITKVDHNLLQSAAPFALGSRSAFVHDGGVGRICFERLHGKPSRRCQWSTQSARLTPAPGQPFADSYPPFFDPMSTDDQGWWPRYQNPGWWPPTGEVASGPYRNLTYPKKLPGTGNPRYLILEGLTYQFSVQTRSLTRVLFHFGLLLNPALWGSGLQSHLL